MPFEASFIANSNPVQNTTSRKWCSSFRPLAATFYDAPSVPVMDFIPNSCKPVRRDSKRPFAVTEFGLRSSSSCEHFHQKLLDQTMKSTLAESVEEWRGILPLVFRKEFCLCYFACFTLGLCNVVTKLSTSLGKRLLAQHHAFSNTMPFL